MIRKAIIILLIVLVFFFLIEGGARVINIFLDMHPLVQLPLPLPAAYNLQVEAVKKPNEVRILCLGDSVTYGCGLKDNVNSSYPVLLEKLLQLKYPNLEIHCYNGGEMASTSYVALSRYNEKMHEINPDIMTLMFGINDSYAVNENPDHVNALRKQSLSFKLNVFLEQSTAYYLLERALVYLKFKVLKSDPTSFDNMRVPPPNFEANLNEFVELARKKNIIVVFLNEWTAGGLREENPATFPIYREIVKKAAANTKSGYLDFKDVIESNKKELTQDVRDKMLARFDAEITHERRQLVIKKPEISHLYADPWHPNEEGHVLLSRALFRYLAYEDYVSRVVNSRVND